MQVRLFVETFDTLVQPIGFQVLKADSHKALDEKKDAYSHGLLVRLQELIFGVMLRFKTSGKFCGLHQSSQGACLR